MTGRGKPLVIRRVRYRSMAEAAELLGITRQAVHAAIRGGWLDTSGLGLTASSSPGARPKPVVIRGVTDPSKAAAARALGVTRKSVSLAKRLGRLDTVGTGRRGVVNLPAKSE